jgi:hypothetical protein
VTPSFCSHNDTTGWGGGGSFTFGLLPHWVDLQGSAMIGRGIGRYGSSQLQSATYAANGSLVALPELMFLGGAIVHATPNLDLYAYGGEERLLSADWTAADGATGFGSPTANNSGCDLLGGTCQGNVRDSWEIAGGFWDKVYQGNWFSPCWSTVRLQPRRRLQWHRHQRRPPGIVQRPLG